MEVLQYEETDSGETIGSQWYGNKSAVKAIRFSIRTQINFWKENGIWREK